MRRIASNSSAASWAWTSSTLALLLLCGCPPETPSDGGVEPDPAPAVDAGDEDAGAAEDSGIVVDSGVDAGVVVDSGVDAGVVVDSGVDAGAPRDSGVVVDSGIDAGVVVDSGVDAGQQQLPDGGMTQPDGGFDDYDAGPPPLALPGLVQAFDESLPFDLNGKTLTFTNDGAGNVDFAVADATMFVDTVGAGDVATTTLSFSSNFESVSFSLAQPFTFAGQSTQTLHLMASGAIGLVQEFSTPTSVDDLFGNFDGHRPLLAFLWCLQDMRVGTVTVDEYADRWVLTVDNATFFGGTGAINVQVRGFFATGVVDVTYEDVQNPNNDFLLVGVSDTDNGGIVPAPVDYVVSPSNYGFWQHFTDARPFALEGARLTITPDGDGFTHSAQPGAMLVDMPGTGTVQALVAPSPDIGFGNDSSQEFVFGQPFPFAGAQRDSLWVSADGVLMTYETSSIPTPRNVGDLFTDLAPAVAFFWTDLLTSFPGNVFFDEYADHFTVSFVGIENEDNEPNTVQVRGYFADGHLEVDYVEVGNSEDVDHTVGVSGPDLGLGMPPLPVALR